jgi:UMF1 family MFS transporter
MDQQMLIIFVILVQVTNVLGAVVFGQLVDRIGGKRSLYLALGLMVVVIVWLYLNQTQTGYFLIGALAGFAMAGAQSVSRTMVAIFAPQGQSAEFYGFFSVAGRTSSFIGPAVYGFIAAEAALWFQAQGQGALLAEQSGQRMAILSIAAFIIAGMVILAFVDENKAREGALSADEREA